MLDDALSLLPLERSTAVDGAGTAREDEGTCPAQADAASAWVAAFGCPAPKRPDTFLLRAVAWRKQVEAHGDVSLPIGRDLQIAANQIAASRVKNASFVGELDASRENLAASAAAAPRRQSIASRSKSNPALPASAQLTPGTRLVKHHAGRNHVVEVIGTGFVYEGVTFASLSAVAKHITGTHWNGLLFFGLRKRGVYAKRQRHG